ncbi:MAG: NUDIX hydrolase [Pseudomonadales bacterium]|jgi:ADP-ribose pyrophosphatase YjhB (NUDIX family)|nr:NUDIX hydrolase [Pseudomonadales bacterium]
MRFCSECGEAVHLRIPQGDERERHVCDGCGTIHYRNPRIVTGCLAVHDGRVLLCRRAIEPRRGFWTLPAGFMENGETAAEGALRETWEEARANVELDGLYTLFNLPHINQVYLFYRGRLVAPEYDAGPESLAVELVAPEDLPWNELAFPVVRDTLRYWCEDRTTQQYPVRSGDVLFSRGLPR